MNVMYKSCITLSFSFFLEIHVADMSFSCSALRKASVMANRGSILFAIGGNIYPNVRNGTEYVDFTKTWRKTITGQRETLECQ